MHIIKTEVVIMRKTQIEIRSYNRKGDDIDVKSDEFRAQVQRITEKVIKKLFELD